MRTIESNQSFSRSKLWQFQRHYFDKKGVEAWSGQVPFYITSNPFIAEVYADVLVHYFMDLQLQNKIDATEPVYIMELGTGSGRFSYYCLKALKRFMAELNCTVSFCYVMTDFTESNLSFWQQHPLLAPDIAEGVLDMALFDLEKEEPLQLVYAQRFLEKGKVKNPLCLIGNYIFDTIVSDVFRAQDHRVLEACVNLQTPEENYQKGTVLALEKIEAIFHYKAIRDKHYDEEQFNKVLLSYGSLLKKTTFMFPLGALRALKHLKSLVDGQLFLLSTDKGYSDLLELEGREDPKVIFHGSFSMSVNFHAIGEYCQLNQGDVFFQTIRKSIKTCAYLMGGQFSQLPLTRAALMRSVETFGPGDYFNFHEHMKKTKETADIKDILSHFYFCRWDPHVFKFFVDVIVKKLGAADFMTKKAFLDHVPILYDNIYPMPGMHDAYFDLAILLHAQEHYQDALLYYQQSEQSFGKRYLVLFNQGLCYYFLQDKSRALQYFQESLSFARENTAGVESWVERITKEISV